jgi:hypothetical protein
MPAAWTPRCKKQLKPSKSLVRHAGSLSPRSPQTSSSASPCVWEAVACPSPPRLLPPRRGCHLQPSRRLYCDKLLPSSAPLMGPITPPFRGHGQVWETLNTSAAGLSSPESVRPCKQPSSTAPWRRQGTALATTNPCAPMQPCSTPPTVSPTTQMLVLARLCSAACRAASA